LCWTAEPDPARNGYSAVHNYASCFWRPYLGNTTFCDQVSGAETSSAVALTAPGAAGTGCAAWGTTGNASGTTRAAPRNTNHPQEEPPANHSRQEALAELQPQLTSSTYQLCLLRRQAQSLQDGVLTLRAVGPLPREFLQHRLRPLLQCTLRDRSGGQVREVVIA
jgi:hypothetical protein